VTDVEFMKRLRSDATQELEWVRVLARILQLTYLEWSDERAAVLEDMIREYDSMLAAGGGRSRCPADPDRH
jgi:hypothetical protein